MKSFKQVAEEFVPKFERATKTDVHYTGRINGKTFVVPHSFHGNHDVLHGTKVTPIRHAIVVSPTHVRRNNPSLSPEEVARVHSHIKDIHSHNGHEASSPVPRLANLDEERQLALHLGMTKSDRPQASKEVPEVKKAETHYKQTHKLVPGTPEHQAERDKYRHAALLASRKAATLAFAKKHHIINEGPMKKPVDLFTHHQTQIAKKTLRMPDAMVGVMGGPNKEESRKHLKKMGWTEKQIHDHEHAQFVHEHVWKVTDHLGHTHEVEAKDHDEAKKKTVSVGGVHPQGIPMTQWGKVQIKRKNLEEKVLTAVQQARKERKERTLRFVEKIRTPHGAANYNGPVTPAHPSHIKEEELEERTLTAPETKKKEELVHKMKPKLQGFKERYGKNAKSVLYATATKQAKRLAEMELHEHSDTDEGMHAYNVHHNGKHIDTIFYGSHQDPAEVKKSLVNHDNYHSDITVTKQRGNKTGAASKPRHMEESFMGTYTRNENANRHTANIVHLAKHFGDAADQAQAKFYAAELKKHGHQPHHEAAYKLHEKLWPYAVAAHHMKEESEQLDELNKGTLKNYIKKAAPDLYHQAGSRQVNYVSSTTTKSAAGKKYHEMEYKRANRKSINREKGIKRAVNKLEEHSDTFNTVKAVLGEGLRANLRSQSDIDKYARRGRAAKNLFRLATLHTANSASEISKETAGTKDQKG